MGLVVLSFPSTVTCAFNSALNPVVSSFEVRVSLIFAGPPTVINPSTTRYELGDDITSGSYLSLHAKTDMTNKHIRLYFIRVITKNEY
jgi:hypothetical protein